MDWQRVLSDVGLPAVVMLGGAWAAWSFFRSHVIPWIELLVKSHAEMVRSVKDANVRCIGQHDEILRVLGELVELHRRRSA